jgi:Ca-activated chloride channel family protein
MAVFRPLLVTAAVLALGAGAAGQQAPQPLLFRSATQTVPVWATVTDAAGRLVPGLRRDDFELYDNGTRVDLSVFDNVVQPISAVLMLDTSGSMTMNRDLLTQAAAQFVERLVPGDRARVGSFSRKIRVSPPEFTGDHDVLLRALREDIEYGNETALWDATDSGMEALKHVQGRRVVVVFTDGADTGSRRNRADILTRARKEEFMIYAIGLRSRLRGHGVVQPDPGLKQVAEDTGGGYFELSHTDELHATFTRVASELHSQYALGFTPQAIDGTVHTLTVRVVRPGLVVRARKSYIAK